MNLAQLLQSVVAQTPVNDSTLQEGVAFTKLFLRYESLLITAASWVIIQAIQKSLPSFANHPISVRVKPFAAILISLGMAYLPSFRLGSWDETLLYGIVLGSLTGLGQKILKQTIFGQDSRIQDFVDDLEPKKLSGHPTARQAQRQRLREKIKHLMT